MSPLRRAARPALMFLLLGLALLAPVRPAAAQTSQRCFPETGYCMDGRIREFWEQNGGLAVFGLPIGPQQAETIEGKQFQVQRFERNRLELHPENARPNDVLLGRLGADRLQQQGRDWQTFAKVGSAPAGCLFFAETGHTLCEPFLSAFRANGLEQDGRRGKALSESIALFGLPLSEPQVETLSDGKNYSVQWFERARFESHPENQPPYHVLLGLLGNEVRDGAQAPAPAPTPADQCADVPEPVNARIRPGKCVAPGTEMAFDIFGFKPNEPIGFWLTDPDGRMAGTVETYDVGPTGAVNDLPFEVDSDMTPGVWYWVFEGTESGHKAIVYFKVLGAQGAAPAQPTGPAALPASQSATVSPEHGRQGTVFTITGSGFGAGEVVGIYATAPDRSVYGATFQQAADGTGHVEVTFHTDRSVPTGVWAITFEGVESGRRAIGYFEVQP